MSNPDVRITLDESADSDAVDEGAVAIDSIIIDPTTYVIPSEEQSLDVDQLGTEVAAEEPTSDAITEEHNIPTSDVDGTFDNIEADLVPRQVLTPAHTRDSRSDTIQSSSPFNSDVKDDQDFTTEETAKKSYQQSATILSPVRIFLPGDVGEFQDERAVWDELEDELTGENIPAVNVSEVKSISASDISSASCTKAHVVFISKENDKAISELKYIAKSSSDLQERYEAKLSDEQKLKSLLATQGNSFLATAALRSTTTTSINCLIGDKVFEWVRGAAMTGWVIKWPRATEASSPFASKNFLVLRDNVLAYYHAPPFEFSVLGSEALKSQVADLDNCLVLNATSTVKLSRMRLRACIRVETQNDKLYFRCPNVEERTRWLVQLQLAIENLTKTAILTNKPRVQCTWYHDSPFLYNISSDVFTFLKKRDEIPDLAMSTSSSPTTEDEELKKSPLASEDLVEAFVYGALFRLDYIDKDLDTTLSEPMSVHRLLANYSLDITVASGERFQRHLTLDSTSGCSLTIMRVLNEHTICVAGNNGLVGLVSTAQEASGQDGRPSLDYAQNPNYELKTVHSEGSDASTEIRLKEASPLKCFREDNSPVHHISSTVNCVAVAEPSPGRTLFAAGDSLGMISMWTLQENNLHLYQDSINVVLLDPRGTEFFDRSSISAGKEPIRTLYFTPDRKMLAIGTSRRLILMTISFESGKYSFSSWLQADGKYVELVDTADSSPSGESCVYAVAFERKTDSEIFDTTVWKLTTFIEASRSNASTPSVSPQKAAPPPPSGGGVGMFGRFFSTLLSKSPLTGNEQSEDVSTVIPTNSILHRIAWGREDILRMLGKMIPI